MTYICHYKNQTTLPLSTPTCFRIVTVQIKGYTPLEYDWMSYTFSTKQVQHYTFIIQLHVVWLSPYRSKDTLSNYAFLITWPLSTATCLKIGPFYLHNFMAVPYVYLSYNRHHTGLIIPCIGYFLIMGPIQVPLRRITVCVIFLQLSSCISKLYRSTVKLCVR
jgi:hypothetical protein